MRYSKENVAAGDFVQINEDDHYLWVIRVETNTFDARGDYGEYQFVPYEDIIDLKLESEYFEIS